MSDDSQIVVPPSFVALFVPPGRTRPAAPREEIAARYEFCEDLAQMLTEPASTRLWELGVSEEVVLERMHQGLSGDGATVSPAEARWVVTRLAELLGWQLPDSTAVGDPAA
jgi:hypothetical protein